MQRIALVAALAVAAASAGCMAGTMTLPPDFVKVQDRGADSYAVRGISADGVMVALSRQENPPNGTLAFWTEAVTNQMVSGRGYKAAGSEPIASAENVPGRLLTFTTEKQGAAFTYMAAVFVKGNDILIAEAGGRTDVVEPKLADIQKAFRSVK